MTIALGSFPRRMLIVGGYSELLRNLRIVVVLVAHIDASGNMGQPPVYVMAGYFAPVAAWELFSREWQLALNTPREADVIKMSHLMALDKAFIGWTEKERDSKLGLLAPIINRYAIGQINIVVPVEAWQAHFVGKLDQSYHNRPYYFAVHSIMSSLAKHLYRSNIHDRVHFVFDSEDAEPIDEIRRTYEQFVRTAPPHLQKQLAGSPFFEKDEDVLPLQAADVLAWHVRRAFVSKHKNLSKNYSVVAKQLFRGCKGIQVEWTAAQLKDAAEFILSRRLWKSH